MNRISIFILVLISFLFATGKIIVAMGERVHIPPSYTIDKSKFVDLNPSNTAQHTPITTTPPAGDPQSLLGCIRIGDKLSQTSGFLNGIYAPVTFSTAKFRYVQLKILSAKTSELLNKHFSEKDILTLNSVMFSSDTELNQIATLKLDKDLWQKIFTLDVVEEKRGTYFKLEQQNASFVSSQLSIKTMLDSINLDSSTKNLAVKNTLSVAFSAQDSQFTEGQGLGREMKYKDEFTMILKDLLRQKYRRYISLPKSLLTDEEKKEVLPFFQSEGVILSVYAIYVENEEGSSSNSTLEANLDLGLKNILSPEEMNSVKLIAHSYSSKMQRINMKTEATDYILVAGYWHPYEDL